MQSWEVVGCNAGSFPVTAHSRAQGLAVRFFALCSCSVCLQASAAWRRYVAESEQLPVGHETLNQGSPHRAVKKKNLIFLKYFLVDGDLRVNVRFWVFI